MIDYWLLIISTKHEPLATLLMKKIITYIILSIALCIGIVALLGKIEPKPKMNKANQMTIICYSCGRGENPENTLKGIKHCQTINPEWRIEMDVQMTADEQLVLFHDYNTKRTTGVNKLINELSLEEVKELNCLLYTSPSPRDATLSRMPSSA